MGQFVSKCPECSAHIFWFLAPPENYVCSCGKAISENELEKSWLEMYGEHLKIITTLDKDWTKHSA